MKNKLLMFVFTLAFGFSASAQWTIDSVHTAGLYPYSGGTSTKAVFSNGTEWNIFDATSNSHTWGPFSISRSMIRTVSYADKVYFGGGKFGYFADPQYTNNVNVYNATTDTWSILTLSKKREVGGAGAAGDKIVFAGGTGRQDISGPVYIYATADIFDATTGARTTGKLSKARSNIAVGASGNKILFAGGWYWDVNYNVVNSNTVDIYDVSTGVWSKSTLTKKRENMAVAEVGSKVIFAGGTGGTSGGPLSDVDIYDVSSNTWSVTNLPIARYGLKSAVIGTNAYFAGGVLDVIENEIDIYNTATKSWSTIYLPVSLSGFSMSVINDKIYFAGGYISSTNSYSDLVQIYDPATAGWSTQYLSVARFNIAAVTCINKGFFAGGYIAYGYPIPVGTNRVDILSVASPIAEFSSNTTVITEGAAVNFIDQSSNNPTSWLWTFNGGTPSTSAEQNPAGIQYNTAGMYDVTLIATNGEGSNTITKVGYITVNAAPCMVPTDFNTTEITSGGATLNWTSVSGATKYKVSWKHSGNDPWTTTTVATNSKILTGLTANTAYLWKVKTLCSQGIASDFSSNQSFITLAGKMQTMMPASGITVYPNPVTDQFTITASEEMKVPATCVLFDVYGNMVKQFMLSDYQQMVNVSDLPAGNYFLRVTDTQNNSLGLQITKE